jgi:hypothetical protein
MLFALNMKSVHDLAYLKAGLEKNRIFLKNQKNQIFKFKWWFFDLNQRYEFSSKNGCFAEFSLKTIMGLAQVTHETYEIKNCIFQAFQASQKDNPKLKIVNGDKSYIGFTFLKVFCLKLS